MTPTEAYEFAVRLATDDDFRERLQRDPVGTLAEHHIHLPPREISSDEVNLPSKEDVIAALESITTGREFRHPFIVAHPDLIIFFFFVL